MARKLPFHIPNSIKSRGILIVILGWAALFLSPSLWTGFMGDDAFLSPLNGYLKYEGITLPQEAFNRITGYATTTGRFSPVLILSMLLLFSSFTNVFWYKCLILLVILLNFLRFHRFLNEIAGPSISLTALLFLVPLMQFRFYHDPILMFHGIIPFLLLLIIESFIALNRYLESRDKRGQLYLSLFFFTLALLTYEVSYIFFPLYFLIILNKEKDRRRIFKLFLPYAFLTALAWLFLLYLKWNSGLPGELKYRPNLDLFVYAKTIFLQLLATLPLSYLLTGPAKVFSNAKSLFADSRILVGAVLVFILAVCSGVFVCRKLRTPEPARAPRNFIIFFALLFWLLPSVLISAVPRYQKDLVIGLGYIPVYLQYFGVAMLASYACTVIFSHVVAKYQFLLASGALCIAISSIALITFLANNATVFRMAPWLYPRLNFESALQGGFLEDVPDDSELLFDNKYVWHDRYFYLMHSGKRLKMNPGTFEALVPAFFNIHVSRNSRPTTGRYFIKEVGVSKQGRNSGAGGLLLSRISGTDVSPARTRELRIFLRVPQRELKASELEFAVRGQISGDKKYSSIPRASMRPVRMRDDWVIYAMQSDLDLNIDTLELIVNPKPLEVTWYEGFYEEERGDELRWRWAAKTATLMITNSTARPQRLRITMSLATGWPENSNLHIESSLLTTTVPIHSEPELFSAVVTVPAHESVPVRFISEAQRVPAEDPREMYFRIQDFRFEPLP